MSGIQFRYIIHFSKGGRTMTNEKTKREIEERQTQWDAVSSGQKN